HALHSFPTRRSSDLRHEGARPRARERLRLQARAVDRTGAVEGDPEGPRQENAREESPREESPREEAEADNQEGERQKGEGQEIQDRKSTRLNSSHLG